MSFLSRLNWIFSEQFGISPRKFLHAIAQIPWYLGSFAKFRQKSQYSMEIMPCLHDRYDQSGNVNNEYFWQDLFVAQKIYDCSPDLHLDVGSRVDGFVAHIASFRVVEVLDIRPSFNEIPNVIPKRIDLMADNPGMLEYCDSISCLHALEHFGLGRYGDSLDPEGWKKGLSNISNILRSGGTMYLSVPVGRPRVVFNAHRVFDIDDLRGEMLRLSLDIRYLYFVEPGKPGVKGGNPDSVRKLIRSVDYVLAIFILRKSTLTQSSSDGERSL